MEFIYIMYGDEIWWAPSLFLSSLLSPSWDFDFLKNLSIMKKETTTDDGEEDYIDVEDCIDSKKCFLVSQKISKWVIVSKIFWIWIYIN